MQPQISIPPPPINLQIKSPLEKDHQFLPSTTKSGTKITFTHKDQPIKTPHYSNTLWQQPKTLKTEFDNQHFSNEKSFEKYHNSPYPPRIIEIKNPSHEA